MSRPIQINHLRAIAAQLEKASQNIREGAPLAAEMFVAWLDGYLASVRRANQPPIDLKRITPTPEQDATTRAYVNGERVS